MPAQRPLLRVHQLLPAEPGASGSPFSARDHCESDPASPGNDVRTAAQGKRWARILAAKRLPAAGSGDGQARCTALPLSLQTCSMFRKKAVSNGVASRTVRWTGPAHRRSSISSPEPRTLATETADRLFRRGGNRHHGGGLLLGRKLLDADISEADLQRPVATDAVDLKPDETAGVHGVDKIGTR